MNKVWMWIVIAIIGGVVLGHLATSQTIEVNNPCTNLIKPEWCGR